MDGQKPKKFRHLFLDAEGTLYVPKNAKPQWEFWADPTPEAAVEFYELDKGVKETLESLRGQMDSICLVSHNPEPILYALLDKFGIRHLFDKIMINGHKGKQIVEYLISHGYRRENALMVGDTPKLDLYPVRRLGVESILIDRSYNFWADAERIKGLAELPTWLKIAEIAEEIGNARPYVASLDDFMSAYELASRSASRSATTKSLIGVSGA
jgi:phosphoglycolate phosphatase-like HAD superfamily hydrolase